MGRATPETSSGPEWPARAYTLVHAHAPCCRVWPDPMRWMRVPSTMWRQPRREMQPVRSLGTPAHPGGPSPSPSPATSVVSF
ncbi:hypothetical protein F751_2252 [Auxenochlorella protothecoides]|uniref:Uncharacterized protein n=1 Tax=Auxenochlorella protothecoides TaxID=3075 RepID=A0A087SMP2_AUXPR|nr:hypothetical protein F751_2252 [Auxenochlorella protothecoides]KFM26996.1 hypothetical protein F751_2252 [Auxenochlorella protothecoides]